MNIKQILLSLSVAYFICLIESSENEEEDMIILNRTRRGYYSTQSNNRKRIKIRNENNCKKIDYNVNFGELGWEKFIIYPKVFNAYLCSGTCGLEFKRFQRRNTVATTNHAQIMSILEFKKPGINREMTKCVSTKLKPLTVIFIDEKGLINTKIYEDMIVDECGCR